MRGPHGALWLGVMLPLLGCDVGSEQGSSPPPEDAPSVQIAPLQPTTPGVPAPPAVSLEDTGPALTREQLFDIGGTSTAPPDDTLDLEALATEDALDRFEPDPVVPEILRDRIRVKHQRRDLGPERAGRYEGGVGEAGVAVPLDPDDSVRVRGGVRVDYDEHADGEIEADPKPTVGVEVQF